MKKRLFLLALALLMAGSCFAGCAGKESNDGEKTDGKTTAITDSATLDDSDYLKTLPRENL